MNTLETTTNIPSGAPRPQTATVNFDPTNRCPLTAAVRAAVRAVDEAQLNPAEGAGGNARFRPKMFLALLSLCYAREIYGSAEIVELLRKDANLRPFCQDNWPDATALRSFRRENRELLHGCLTRTLRILVEQKVSAGLVSRTSGGQLAEEARRRIIMSMFTDSLDPE